MLPAFCFKSVFLDQSAQTLFTHLVHLPWAVLLESAAPDHPDSRFDILTADPCATLETWGSETRIRTNGTIIQSGEDPFTLIDHWVNTLLPEAQNTSTELPFIGGAIGLLGYDLGRRLERVPSLAQRDIDIPDMAVGIYNWAWILDHQTQQAHFVVYGTEADWQARWQWWHTQIQHSTQPSEPIVEPFQRTSDWQSNLPEPDYLARFERIQDYIRAGDCYQINLTQRFHCSYQGDPWLAYCQLVEANQAPFSGFMRLSADTAILSVSPERFLLLNGQHIETKPIKGTQPRNADPIRDQANIRTLQQSEKDQAENLMIVDLLRNDLGRVSSPGSVRVPHLFAIESFAAVHHLVSTVTGELAPDYSAMQLMAACFPGGSITGAPKIRAMEIIEELEPQRRSAYCGSLFYWSRHGRMDSSITIRTLIATEHTLYVWAGGGIVADSQGKAEYQETFDKLSKILTVLS